MPRPPAPPRRKCADCPALLRPSNPSIYCSHCRKAHQCAVCDEVFAELLPGKCCAGCRPTLDAIDRVHASNKGMRRPPADELAARIEHYRRLAKLGLPLFDETKDAEWAA